MVAEDAGIAHRTIVQVGDTMQVSHLSMEEFLTVGGKTIGIIVGMDENGIINRYLMRNFERYMKGMFVRNLDMEDVRGEDKLEALKIYSLLRQSSPRLNSSRVFCKNI